MLPVSGAIQLKAREPIGLRPMISESGAYSETFRPLPYSSSGMKRFHSPAALAFRRTSLRIFRLDMLLAMDAHFLVDPLLDRIDMLVHERRNPLLIFLVLGESAKSIITS